MEGTGDSPTRLMVSTLVLYLTDQPLSPYGRRGCLSQTWLMHHMRLPYGSCCRWK